MSTPRKPLSVDELIVRGRAYGPSAGQLEDLARRLGPVVGPGTGTEPGGGGTAVPTPSAPPSAPVGSLLAQAPWVAKGLGVLLTVAGAGGAAWWLGSAKTPHDSLDPLQATPPATQVETSKPDAANNEALVAPPTATPTPSTSAPQRHAGVRPPTASSFAGRARSTSADGGTPDARLGPTEEAALIDLARSSLTEQPQRALALTAQHRRQYPHGLLAQERDVIEIEALQRLGRANEAEREADRFAREHPGSAHQPRIRAVMGEGGVPVESR